MAKWLKHVKATKQVRKKGGPARLAPARLAPAKVFGPRQVCLAPARQKQKKTLGH